MGKHCGICSASKMGDFRVLFTDCMTDSDWLPPFQFPSILIMEVVINSESKEVLFLKYLDLIDSIGILDD